MIVGTDPFGFRPGLPFGLTTRAASLPSAVEACRAVPSSLLLLIIGLRLGDCGQGRR